MSNSSIFSDRSWYKSSVCIWHRKKSVQVFWLKIVVIKFVYHQFGNFENAKTYTLTCPANEREIINDDFCTAKSRPTHRLRQLI